MEYGFKVPVSPPSACDVTGSLYALQFLTRRCPLIPSVDNNSPDLSPNSAPCPAHATRVDRHSAGCPLRVGTDCPALPCRWVAARHGTKRTTNTKDRPGRLPTNTLTLSTEDSRRLSTPSCI